MRGYTVLAVRRGWACNVLRTGRRTKLHSMWCNMQARCAGYGRYARWYSGIEVRWNSYEEFREWACRQLHQRGGWEPGLSLDRIDPTQDYGPDNCRLIPRRENSLRATLAARHKRFDPRLTPKIEQSALTVKETARKYGVSPSTVDRIRAGKHWTQQQPRESGE